MIHPSKVSGAPHDFGEWHLNILRQNSWFIVPFDAFTNSSKRGSSCEIHHSSLYSFSPLALFKTFSQSCGVPSSVISGIPQTIIMVINSKYDFTVSIIVISETVFSKEVVVEKLQVSVSTKWPPTSFLICSVNCGKISSHKRLGSFSFLWDCTIKDSFPEKFTKYFLKDSWLAFTCWAKPWLISSQIISGDKTNGLWSA